MAVGVWFAFRHPYARWTLLDRPKPERSHIFFERTWLGGLRRLALETPSPDPGNLVPFGPQPSSLKPGTNFEDWYHTWAILNDIRTIRPCYSRRGGIQIFIGLLFSDSDGCESCVGQIRHDCLGSAKTIDVSEKLWLGFQSMEDDQPCVVRVETCEPRQETKNIFWLDIPWRGKLEWWFSYTQCKVWHEGRTSPNVRLW